MHWTPPSTAMRVIVVGVVSDAPPPWAVIRMPRVLASSAAAETSSRVNVGLILI